MIDIERLKKQHSEILDSINYIESFIKNNDFNRDLSELAEEVNVLAGKLKIHLSVEDEFVYPELLKKYGVSENYLLKNYLGEVKELDVIFAEYINRFNRADKICNNIEEFIESSDRVFKIIKTRIQKEDKELFS
jgi:hemerythrin-like domain-containing protein